MQWSIASYPSPDQSVKPTALTPLATMTNEFPPTKPIPQGPPRSQFFENQLACVSRLGTISLHKPWLSLLQTPVPVSFGDWHIQVKRSPPPHAVFILPCIRPHDLPPEASFLVQVLYLFAPSNPFPAFLPLLTSANGITQSTLGILPLGLGQRGDWRTGGEAKPAHVSAPSSSSVASRTASVSPAPTRVPPSVSWVTTRDSAP